MKALIITALILNTTIALAWEGYDYQSNQNVGIDQGNTVRQGSSVQVYEYGNSINNTPSGYKDYNVDSVRQNGFGGTTVEVTDPSTGQFKTFDMPRQ